MSISENIWELRLASDADPADRRGTRYWVTLPVENLDVVVGQAIHSYQNSHSPRIDLAKEPSPMFPQLQTEYRTLLAFQRRLEAMSGERLAIEAGAGELPISFNVQIFAGNFRSVECAACGRSSSPQETYIRPFADEDGMQDHGQERHCSCGQVIAYRIDGYRRP